MVSAVTPVASKGGGKVAKMNDKDRDDTGNFSLRIVSGKLVDISQWATPDEGALTGDVRKRYLTRKLAVTLFLSGASDKVVKQRTSIGAKQAYRLIRERCLEVHPDGRPYGWRGLIPRLRIRPYTRRNAIRVDAFGFGAVGALQTLLDSNPDLKRDLNKRILSIASGEALCEIKRSIRQHWHWFLDKLRERGYEARQEWPFTTISQGYFSIRSYVDSVLESSPKALANAAGGPDLVAKLKTGDGADRPVTRFMQRVEMDAHKLDGLFCVSLPRPDGSYKEKIVHRLWVIVILEVISRVVLGYYLSLRREVSQDDVLRAIKRALTHWAPRKISFSDAAYLPQAGMLSVLGADFAGLCWDECSVDGALAEASKHVRSVLRDAVGSALLEPRSSFSKRRGKDDRPFIEAFFRNLAGRGFQRLSNTTGAKVQDRKGRKPDEVAIASRFQYEYAEELLDVLIANYNATKHSGIGQRTPLEYAQFLYQRPGLNLRHIDRNGLTSFFSVRKRCVVRGGAQSGRAPYVEFRAARYSSDTLRNRQDLVGKQIWVISHNEDDARIALASTLEGAGLGVLRAAPPWHRTPHSLSVRSAICQSAARGKFSISAGTDAVETFMNYVEGQPDRKLAVHPAYLELRRILETMAQQSVGMSLLAAAHERATLERNSDVGSTETAAARPAILPPPGKTVTNNSSVIPSTLPPRRKTAAR